jgi:hypothetical protein
MIFGGEIMMPNGIHTIDEIINCLAETAIYNIGYECCFQKYFMAEELGISVGELEVVCDYFNIALEN